MKYIVSLNGKDYEVEVEKGEARVISECATVAQAPVAQAQVSAPAQALAPAPSTGSGTAIPSPLTGLIVKTLVKPGDKVPAGGVLLILEAMKMENEIVAPKDLTVVNVLVSSGQNVNTNDTLVTYE